MAWRLSLKEKSSLDINTALSNDWTRFVRLCLGFAFCRFLDGETEELTASGLGVSSHKSLSLLWGLKSDLGSSWVSFPVSSRVAVNEIGFSRMVH